MHELPSVRTYPRTDSGFAADLTSAILATSGNADETLEILRARYPKVRISVRAAIAGFDDGPMWYAFRDGAAVSRGDGVGAMRLWTPIERETRRSMDLIEWSDRLLRQSSVAARAFAYRGGGQRGRTPAAW